MNLLLALLNLLLEGRLLGLECPDLLVLHVRGQNGDLLLESRLFLRQALRFTLQLGLCRLGVALNLMGDILADFGAAQHA